MPVAEGAESKLEMDASVKNTGYLKIHREALGQLKESRQQGPASSGILSHSKNRGIRKRVRTLSVQSLK